MSEVHDDPVGFALGPAMYPSRLIRNNVANASHRRLPRVLPLRRLQTRLLPHLADLEGALDLRGVDLPPSVVPLPDELNSATSARSPVYPPTFALIISLPLSVVRNGSSLSP